MDNEASKCIEGYILEIGAHYQLVELHNHRVNATKWVIWTFKNHFIAGLATTDPDFPLARWDDLLQQAEITVNLLCQSRLHPQLSAYLSISISILNYAILPPCLLLRRHRHKPSAGHKQIICGPNGTTYCVVVCETFCVDFVCVAKQKRIIVMYSYSILKKINCLSQRRNMSFRAEARNFAAEENTGSQCPARWTQKSWARKVRLGGRGDRG